jgi:hypothetical protein
MTQVIPLRDAKAAIAKAKEIYSTTSDDPIVVNGINFPRKSIDDLKEFHGVDAWQIYEGVVQKELDLQHERDRIKDRAINQEKTFLK